MCTIVVKRLLTFPKSRTERVFTGFLATKWTQSCDRGLASPIRYLSETQPSGLKADRIEAAEP